MGFEELANYVVFTNPVSKSLTSFVAGNTKSLPAPPTVTVITEKTPLWKLANEGGPFVRLAGIMGMTATILGAYGAHRTYPKDTADELKIMFDTANRYHFFHSLALLSVPLCKNPKIAGILFISGTILFSGTLYHRAFTGDDTFGKLTPIGGSILILAWLSMVV
uniref:DUF423 domain-containing protein n=1 Tax=Dendroctonus ponderosae TaxID=77166 RepID=J3JTL9_DENPD|nr:unknown [Dendroctonus ponderosae]